MNTRIALGAAGVAMVGVGLVLMFNETWLRAHLGGADSQLKLAHAYGTGLGTERDDVKAAAWYRRAAEQGHSTGQLALAARYDEGLGVEEDPEAASDWYRKAADRGSTEAQLALALRYHSGRGVPRDDVQAAMWLILAGESGVARPDGRSLLETLKESLAETELTEARRLAADWRATHPNAKAQR